MQVTDSGCASMLCKALKLLLHTISTSSLLWQLSKTAKVDVLKVVVSWGHVDWLVVIMLAPAEPVPIWQPWSYL